MSRLRAGLIGLGAMGRHHVRVLSGLDGVDLVAVADPGGDVHNVMGGRRVLDTVAEVIAARPDYCVVAVPTEHHERVGLALAEARIHALIEKPLAMDAEAARRLTDAFAAASLIGGVGHIERYNAALGSLRTRLSHGDLGEIYQVCTRRQGPFPARIADVGVIKDLATHDIDLTAWITGQPYQSVSARTSTRSGRPHEDLVAVTGLLSGGTVASHLVNWISPFKERLTLVTGAKGAFAADTLTADLTFYANGSGLEIWDGLAGFRGVSEGDTVRFALAKPEPLQREHEAFRDAVLGLDSEIVSFADGAQTLVVAGALLASADRGVTVDIER